MTSAGPSPMRRDDAVRLGPQLAVGARDALGAAGAAGRVLEDGIVVRGAAPQRRRRVTVDERVQRDRVAVGAVGGDDRRRRVPAGDDLAARRHPLAAGDHRADAAVAHAEAQLGLLVLRVERDGDGAQPERGEEARHERRALAQDEADRIAGGHAGRRQPVRQARDLLLELGVGDAAIAVHERRAVAMIARGRGEHLDDRPGAVGHRRQLVGGPARILQGAAGHGHPLTFMTPRSWSARRSPPPPRCGERPMRRRTA